MSRSELVRLSGISKQQLSRLENGLIRLRLDHLKPFAPHLGYSPEQILLWGRLPGTEMPNSGQKLAAEPAIRGVLELDTRASTSGTVGKRNIRKRGTPHRSHTDRAVGLPGDLHARGPAFLGGTTTRRSVRG